MNATIRFGDVTVTRVLEWAGPIKTVAEILPDTPAEDWPANRSMMAPDFWDPETNAYLCHIQTWVIRAAGRTILVDTGVGNDRERPQIPTFAHLQTDFLDRLGTAGVEPEDVDTVINTHSTTTMLAGTRACLMARSCRRFQTLPTSFHGLTTITTIRTTPATCARPKPKMNSNVLKGFGWSLQTASPRCKKPGSCDCGRTTMSCRACRSRSNRLPGIRRAPRWCGCARVRERCS